MRYLSRSKRTEHSLNLRVFRVFIFLFFLVFVIRGDFDRTNVREFHRGATRRISQRSTQSGIGDDQVALWNDGHGDTGLNHGTPTETLILQSNKSKLHVY